MDLRSLGIEAVLFDKDGTLFDFDATWVAWAEKLFVKLSDGDAALAGRLGAAIGFDRDSRRFVPGSPAIAGTPLDVARALAPVLNCDPHDLLRDINAAAAKVEVVSPVPLRPLLDGLRRAGLGLGVATNDGEAPARAHLASAGVLEAFDFIVGADSGFTPKPHPAMCLGFARAVQRDPRRIAMVGDSLHDLHAARAAGMIPIGVLTGPATRATLEPHAALVLDHIGALATLSG